MMGNSEKMDTSGVGVSTPSILDMETNKNGTEVPTPEIGNIFDNSGKRSRQGVGVSTPLTSSIETNYGTEVPTPIHGNFFGSSKKIITSGAGVSAPSKHTPAPKRRKILPHVDEIGYYQFVTFRTRESIDEYLKKVRTEKMSRRIIEYKIDQYVDTSLQGRYLDGEILIYLRQLFFDNDDTLYHLIAFAIMPNHVHILFRQNDSLSKIMKRLKGSSAFKINKMLGRKGEFWENNYYDIAMRDDEHFRATYDYIKHNPIKAGLVDAKERFYGIYD